MHSSSTRISILALAFTLCAGSALAAPAAQPASGQPAPPQPAPSPAPASSAQPAPASSAQPAPAAEPAPAANAAPAGEPTPAAEAAPAPAAEAVPAPEAAPVAAEPPAPVGGPVPGSNPKYVNLSLEELEDKRSNVSLGGPIVMLAIGAPLAIIGTSWFIGSTIGYMNCAAYDRAGFTESGNICRTTEGVVMVLSGAMIAAGVPLSVIGGINLGKRINERRSLGKEIDLRTKGEDYSLVLTPVYLPGGMGAGLRGTF